MSYNEIGVLDCRCGNKEVLGDGHQKAFVSKREQNSSKTTFKMKWKTLILDNQNDHSKVQKKTILVCKNV